MKKIISDCDNTFGVRDCDVDDGLTPVYSPENRETQLLGIMSTYGNSSLDVVQAVNLRILGELGCRDIPVKRGGEKRGCYQSETVVFLAEMVDRHPGELPVLATGSLTNLKDAYERGSHFFEKVKEIVLMDGITSPLVFEKKVVEELNSLRDPSAARTVLIKGRNVSIITDNNCLRVLFTKQEYRERLSGTESRAAAYVMEKIDDWFRYNDEGYGIHGFYNWDVTAAVYSMHPESFAGNVKSLCVSDQDLGTGYPKMEEDEMNGGRKTGIKAGTEVGMRGIMKDVVRDGMKFQAADGRCTCDLLLIRNRAVFKDNIYRSRLSVTGILADV